MTEWKPSSHNEIIPIWTHCWKFMRAPAHAQKRNKKCEYSLGCHKTHFQIKQQFAFLQTFPSSKHWTCIHHQKRLVTLNVINIILLRFCFTITVRLNCRSSRGDKTIMYDWQTASVVHPTLTSTLPAEFLEISLPGTGLGYGKTVLHKGWLLPYIRTRWSWWVGYNPLICPPSVNLYLLWSFTLTSSEPFIRSWGSAALRISLYCLTRGQACLKALFSVWGAYWWQKSCGG